MSSNIVITMARQYGSGGKTIGAMLAKELGINCYSREILRMASEESGINERLFGMSDEKMKGAGWFKILSRPYDGELLPPEDKDFVSEENIFNYQAKIIKDLAEKESCVIVGRCADYVLKDNPNVVSVFVHADEKFCLDRAMERNSMTEKEMKKYIEKTDKFRGDFYRYHTGHEWADARNYDLCLNSGKLGFQKCVEEIKANIKIRFDLSMKEKADKRNKSARRKRYGCVSLSCYLKRVACRRHRFVHLKSAAYKAVSFHLSEKRYIPGDIVLQNVN